MTNLLGRLYWRHKEFWSKQNLVRLFQAVVFFIAALVLQHFVYNYIDYRASVTPVGDLLLDNLPTINLDFFIVQGALICSLIVVGLLLANPRSLPYAVKTIALFLIIRSGFISLTHLGANLHQLTLNIDSVGFSWYDFLYNSKNDFFFSGHVGASFLIALIFWKETFFRYFFLVASGIFAASMILAHMHYSIDVFAAPFITYGIFVISKKLFKPDFALIS